LIDIANGGTGRETPIPSHRRSTILPAPFILAARPFGGLLPGLAHPLIVRILPAVFARLAVVHSLARPRLDIFAGAAALADHLPARRIGATAIIVEQIVLLLLLPIAVAALLLLLHIPMLAILAFAVLAAGPVVLGHDCRSSSCCRPEIRT
jgi:hypothetical protein